MKKSAQKDAIVYALLAVIGYQALGNPIPLIIGAIAATSALFRSKLS